MFITGQRTSDYILGRHQIAVLGVCHRWRNELLGGGLRPLSTFLVTAEFFSLVIQSVHICPSLLNMQKPMLRN